MSLRSALSAEIPVHDTSSYPVIQTFIAAGVSPRWGRCIVTGVFLCSEQARKQIRNLNYFKVCSRKTFLTLQQELIFKSIFMSPFMLEV